MYQTMIKLVYIAIISKYVKQSLARDTGLGIILAN